MTTISFNLEDVLLSDESVVNLRVVCDYSPAYKYGHERGGPMTPDDEEDMSIAHIYDDDTNMELNVSKEDEKKILALCWKDLEASRQP